MKKIFASLFVVIAITKASAQETIYPAPAQNATIALTHATIHIGNGEVLNDGMIVFSNGKIIDVRPTANIADIKVFDCSGKHIYPGLISPVTNLGLNEISAVRSTVDDRELGDINPNIHAAIAYNTDSKVIDILRANGVLLANVIPDGGIISGTSSVMQLDAWNWEDALYKKDAGIHFRLPYLVRYSAEEDALKEGMKQIEEVRQFFRDAKAYFGESKHEHTNIKFEAVKGLFDRTQIFYAHCELVKEMMVAVEFANEFGFKTVIVGGTDSWKIADYLKQNNISVILNQVYSLPAMQDDDYDLPYKTPYLLQQAGVLYCISDADQSTRFRNLPFDAGTAVGFGLTKEQALQAVTLNTAKILGIDNSTGSLEKGKDANIVVSDGDLLDMKTSNVAYAFIQGRQINLDNKQKQLFEKYKYKYNLK
ncbi:MAG TPA: amidohydrolase family protein [Panacibacter sp.]|nr:amidohydrolase family protein [Panacibacter sp.]HNP46322.1 amidohydrolase family protein [Panacibacter sp.]